MFISVFHFADKVSPGVKSQGRRAGVLGQWDQGAGCKGRWLGGEGRGDGADS